MHSLAKGTVLMACILSGSAWAYGGGGGGSSGCAEPKFFDPKPSGSVPALAEFAFIASDNTDSGTLTVQIDGQAIQPALDRRRNGDWQVKAVLSQPITEPGRVRISVKAKSRDGCWGFQPYYVEIKP
ncbi:hypothetical protein [Methylocaldum sp.]|uniref:hypothetical protein n=1 Tax=Methylocaldum sp. TaxID=1969727 RepID=UPI002D66E2AB|nr:hypothetical protein [Methylocaldum sp.]HYE33868.1 hypothetical protein [Methylocaldum sp.]